MCIVSLKMPFCSRACVHKFNTTKQLIVCKRCCKEFYKTLGQIKRSPNHFCCKSCACTWNNMHKKYGTRRSKLEVWIEERLMQLYSDLVIEFNQKDAINSELDIYIPSLKLAFELNGIFHYEPIFGKEKLKSIKNNDNRKYQACIDAGISLCIINTSAQSYVKPKTSQKYLDIICRIIELNIAVNKGFEPSSPEGELV